LFPFSFNPFRPIRRNGGGSSDATIQKSKLKIKTEEDKITGKDEDEDESAHEGNQDSARDSVNGYNDEILPSQARNSDLSSLPQSPSQPKAEAISLESTINEQFSQAKSPTCNAADVKYGSLSEKHDSYCLSSFSSSSFSLSSTNSSTISDLLAPIDDEEDSGFDPEQRRKPRFRLLTELYKTQHENVPSNHHSLKRHSSRRQS
jgi:hypothetical protein